MHPRNGGLSSASNERWRCVRFARKLVQTFVALIGSFGCSAVIWAQASNAVIPAPLIAEGQTRQLSSHVYVILDEDRRFVPNVGIVVGSESTLVIDTGVGMPNGEIVLRETNKISNNRKLYFIATHYHAEHALGVAAFPQSAVIIRSRDQQQDMDEFGRSHVERLSQMSPALADLLQGAQFEEADVYFDDEYRLDLGGVTVRMYAVGPAHTRGDTVVFVEEDRVVFSGDVAMQRYPMFASPSSGVEVWRQALAALAKLDATLVVPSHGPVGGSETVSAYDEFFETLQRRVMELKGAGQSAEEVAAVLSSELSPRYVEWGQGSQRVGDIARIAYAEIP